uniref:ORF1a protein n=1 Tax=Aethomys rat astrovirus TaxID=3141853 RepID=A0AAU7E1E2_9VIRU
MASFQRCYSSKVDAATNAGNYLARLQVGENAIYQLRKIPEHRPESPWSIHSTPRHLIYPSTDMNPRNRVITASSVTVNNEWVTYVWENGSWQQTATAPDDKNVILVCALFNEKHRLAEENSGLKVRIQDLEVQLTTLRHAYERVAPIPRRRSWFWVIFAFLCLFVSLFVQAGAMETTSTTRSFDPEEVLRLNEDLDAFIEKAMRVNWTRSITEHHFTVLTTSAQTWYKILMNDIYTRYSDMQVAEHRRLFMSIITNMAPWSWEICAIALACATIYTGKNVMQNLVYLIIASLTRMRFMLLAIAPLQTAYTTFVTGFLSVLFVGDPILAVALSILHCFGFAVVGLFLADTEYLLNLRACCAITLVYTGYWVLETLSIPTTVVTGLVVAWRVTRLLSMIPPNTIEVRDVSGKVVGKVSGLSGPLFRFTQSLRTHFKNPFQQVRTKVAPLARVNPAALCHISTNDGSKGTGFFCANYIVTAGHVVGTHAVVTVNYLGKNYNATVKRKPEEKDMALLEIPSSLQSTPRLKVSKTHKCEWVCLCAPSGEGAYLTSVVEGHEHDGTYSYAVPTRDGMSGAPLLDVDGHVIGIHQTNTGYTGGAIRLDLNDVVDPPKHDGQMADLKAEIANLRKQLEEKNSKEMQQCAFGESDIVNLVRAAMQREMAVLRDEINNTFAQKKKGKTKHGRGRRHATGARTKKKKVPMFTEEEYQEMLDEGLDPDQIRALAEELYDQEIGFPEWSDPEDEEDVDEWWFAGDTFSADVRDLGSDHEDDYHQRCVDYHQKMKIPLIDYLVKHWTKESVKDMLESVPPSEAAPLAPVLKYVKEAVDSGDAVKTTVGVACLDRALTSAGRAPVSDSLDYTQRVRPKNGKRGPQGPQKQTLEHGKKKQ